MSWAANVELLVAARRVLHARSRTYWLLGGAAAGKSTVAQALAARYGMLVLDMDARLYGSYGARYTPEWHPANRAWLDSGDPLGWQLAMHWDGFDAWTCAANAEALDLLAEELHDADPAAPLLIDGGFSHPTLLAQVAPTAQIACLQAPTGWSERQWAGVPERRALRDEVLRLPGGAGAWQRFLQFDANMTAGIVAEARACSIAVYAWQEGETVAALAERVAMGLGLAR